MDDFLEQKVNVDLYFFNAQKLIEAVTVSGFTIIDVIERHPYKEVGYPGKRAYVWVKK